MAYRITQILHLHRWYMSEIKNPLIFRRGFWSSLVTSRPTGFEKGLGVAFI